MRHWTLRFRALVTLIALGSVPAVAAAGPDDEEAPAGETAADGATTEAGTADGAPTEPAADVPAEPPPPTPPPAASGSPVSASYDKGLIFSAADGRFDMKLGFKNQVRFESTHTDADGAEFVSRFLIPRARLVAEGFAFGKDLTYKLEFSFSDRGFGFLKDFFLNKQLGKVQVRFGQWKRPFNRQEIVSDFASEFAERAITNEFAGGGRDLGVAIHNGYEKSPDGVEWALGVFSGATDRPAIVTTCTPDPADPTEVVCTSASPTNVRNDFAPVLVARVGYNQGGIKGYSEADLEGGPLRWAVAASYKLDLNNLQSSDALKHAVEGDFLVKVNGFDAVGGVYLVKDQAISPDAELGFLGQFGYFVTPQHAQVGGRFALVPVGDESRIEARGCFNYYLEGHNWKWANDAGAVILTGDAGVIDYQVRSWAQLAF